MVIFWLVVPVVLAALFIIWYRYAKPARKFNLQRSTGRFKTITTWDTEHTRKECPACGGWGDLLLDNGRLVKIPRHRREHARWVSRGMTMTCRTCNGIGNVARNWRPAGMS